jgi:threonine dehydrogenase-like Zn-dependent dehydrogenase
VKALTYHGRHDVRVDSHPDPKIEAPDDAVIRITATAICGSDLHMYLGWMAPFMKSGDILGHEFMGIVEEVGPEVKTLKPGDRVIVPFLISCGSCFFCDQQLYSACERSNPDPGSTLNRKGVKPPARLYGYSHLFGGTPGGQAEYVRVLMADSNAKKIDDALTDEQVLFLTDILPTGFQAVVQAGVTKGSTVAIIGAGPVGLMAALSAKLLGAAKIYIVDDLPYRLEFAAERYGAVPINFKEVEDPAALIVEQTNGRGVDATVDAVGFEAKGNKLESTMRGLMLESGSGTVLREGIAAVRRGGTLSIPGVYVGFLHGFLIGDAFDKGLTFKMGQTHVHRYVDELHEAIRAGKIDPSEIITHRLPLAEAPAGYKTFANQEDNCRKVVLFPHGLPAR